MHGKNDTFIIIVIFIIVIIGVAIFTRNTQKGQINVPLVNQQGTMQFKSSSFGHNQSIPKQYTCDGQDINPPLQIADVPEGTQSLVLIVDDPDAPIGDWVHWLVWNIAPETTDIAENSVPTGAIQGTTDFGHTKWGGPCPPSGAHRYFFKLYALDTTLDLSSETKKRDLEQAMQGHILDEAVLVGVYQRQK